MTDLMPTKRDMIFYITVGVVIVGLDMYGWVGFGIACIAGVLYAMIENKWGGT